MAVSTTQAIIANCRLLTIPHVLYNLCATVLQSIVSLLVATHQKRYFVAIERLLVFQKCHQPGVLEYG